jgi:NAD(P)-dependent dehydrogenase (short-subunit alcohol dehydrogenase family)
LLSKRIEVIVSKLAIITGASGALGQALAEKLLLDHWLLILVGRDPEKLKAAYGDKHIQIIADCNDADGVKKIFELIKANQLNPTCLAHCVGNIKLGALHRMAESDFIDCMQTNLFSAFYTLKYFTCHLKESKLSGSAVFVSSAAARICTPNHEAIAAAKGGLEALARVDTAPALFVFV